MNIQQVLQNVNGNSFMGIDTLTKEDLTGGKKNPHQGRVTKACIGSQVQCFQNKHVNGYDAMVKRRLVAEGKAAEDFQLGPRAWGTRLPNEPIIEHKGEYYLEVIFKSAGNVEYMLDGVPCAKSQIEGLKPSSGGGEQGGLDNKVVIRTYKLSSIQKIRIDGQEYVGPFTY